MQLIAKVPKHYLGWILRSRKKSIDLQLEKMEVGGKTTRFLRKLREKKRERKVLALYITATKQLKRRLLLHSFLMDATYTKNNSLDMVETLGKAFFYILLETDISAIKNKG